MRAKFFKDGALLLAAEFISRLFAFSVSFVLAREIGLAALAVLTLAQSIVSYATVAGDAGLGTEAVRRIASGEPSGTVVRQTARLQIFFALLASAIVVPLAMVQTDSLVAIGVALVPALVAASATYVLQGRLDARSLAISRVFGNSVVGVLGIVMSLMGLPLWAIASSYSVGALVSMLYVNYRAGIGAAEIFGRVPWHALSSGGSKYLSLASYTVVLHGYSSCLIIMAQNFGGGSLLVDVALATRVLLLLVIPGQLLGSLLLPRYSRASVSLRTLCFHLVAALIVGGLITIFVHLCAEWFVPLMFGPESLNSVSAVEMISVQVPLSLASTVLVTFFLATGRFATVALIYAAALIAQLGLGFWLGEFHSEVFVMALVLSEWIFVLMLLSALLLTGSRQAPRTRVAAKVNA